MGEHFKALFFNMMGDASVTQFQDTTLVSPGTENFDIEGIHPDPGTATDMCWVAKSKI
jgi:hypothetical protein